MNEKPAWWADALLTVWVIVVSVVYFGGLFQLTLGAMTGNFAAFYAFMLLVGALTLAQKFLHSDHDDPSKTTPRTKNRK